MKKYNDKQLIDARTSGRILRETFELVKSHIKAGVTTLELDRIAERFIRDQGAVPCFKGYNGYMFSLCTSVNEECIHGLPSAKRVLQNGDIISIDVGVRYPKGKGGMCTDAARTYGVGEISKEAQELITITQQCFNVAIKGLKAGELVSSIGKKIEKFIDGRYGIIDTYMGHGIGEMVHEQPAVPNFDVLKHESKSKFVKVFESLRLVEGTMICIEPMINQGTKNVNLLADGWTVVTADGKLAAHYENTILIHKDKVEILT